VACVGLDVGVFPSARTLAEAETPVRQEEERRLAYGLDASETASHPRLRPCAPSAFVEEAFDPEELERVWRRHPATMASARSTVRDRGKVGLGRSHPAGGRTRGRPARLDPRTCTRAWMRAWWLVLACYAFAAVAWHIAITPLPVALAWLATIPAAVATVIPERLAAAVGGGTGRGRRRIRQPQPLAPSVRQGRPMARPIGASHSMARPARRRSVTAIGVLYGRASEPTPAQPIPPSEPTAGSSIGALLEAPRDVPVVSSEPAAVAQPTSPGRRSTRSGRHRWHPGDSAWPWRCWRTPPASPTWTKPHARIDVRLDRLDRFREAASAELLALVRDDVHARLDIDIPGVDPDPEPSQIAWLLDDLGSVNRPAGRPWLNPPSGRSQPVGSTGSAGPRVGIDPRSPPPGHSVVSATSRWPVASPR
jgi:hypothetical protein